MRLRVLQRDAWRCRIVQDCPERASVADHVIAVFPGMPDALFYSESNLRAGCREHNLARAGAAKLESAAPSGPTDVVRSDYS